MKLWLIQTRKGYCVINPSGLVFDIEYLKKWGIYEFEIPDNVTDYMFTQYDMRFTYVLNGELHVSILDMRNRD